MSEEEQKKEILKYLADHGTMILSTVGPEGPWATPVFYVNRGFKLYFLSETKTRHSQNLRDDNRVAAAITADHKDWQTIQGLQLKGKAFLVDGAKEEALAMTAYCMKFPAVKQVFQTPKLFKGVAFARWHCFQPEELSFTDNTEKFGQRIEIKLL